MRRQSMAETTETPIELGDYKLIVVFEGEEVSTYASEEEALDGINMRDRAASDVRCVLIGKKLGMLTQRCERLLCLKQSEGREVLKLDGTRLED